ncbi:putative ankyrin repeat-containing domain, PGG domain-containing protein [Rosa chinensis]|uniref:Putative ankyrin repeat-containing domain, PGG domain-containing protein n=1 Tax=Rosa chinensis TaxID=74649 RepID=A0A2P6SE35_ROSCH|nr:putative ankyrin repeat-containing domain, PGG domain-containing protein [Rosa chinensis]
MENKDLEMVDRDGHTPLSMAILEKDTDVMTEIAKCMVEKNKQLLLRIVDPSTNTIPLLMALTLERPKMATYLYDTTPLEKLKNRDRAELLSTSLRVKHLDKSWDLIQRFPSLAIAQDHSGESPLNELASTPGLFLNTRQLRIWERWIYYFTCFSGGLVANLLHLSGINRIYQMKLLHVKTIEILRCMHQVLESEDNLNYRQHKLVQKAFFQAAERGHAPFICHLLRSYPRFLAITNENDKTVFQFAAEHRQDKIFNLIHGFDEQKRKDIVGRKDKFGNNMLHVVGKLSPSRQITHIRGAVLQMQKELQWFKKVERMASPKDLNCINSDGRTPREEFTMNHRNLVEAAEKSIKETATSSSALVAALIITIMFAATVTTPGGIKDITGIPIYLDTKAFRIFIVADVTSLCSSTTSVMIFLGILTSRFSEEDFLTSLPTKLIIGFLTLFLSIGAMMIAFSSSIFIMLHEQQSIVSLSIVLAILPIASFLWMQFPFLLDIIISTYGFKVFRRRVETVRF